MHEAWGPGNYLPLTRYMIWSKSLNPWDSQPLICKMAIMVPTSSHCKWGIKQHKHTHLAHWETCPYSTLTFTLPLPGAGGHGQCTWLGQAVSGCQKETHLFVDCHCHTPVQLLPFLAYCWLVLPFWIILGILMIILETSMSVSIWGRKEGKGWQVYPGLAEKWASSHQQHYFCP